LLKDDTNSKEWPGEEPRGRSKKKALGIKKQIPLFIQKKQELGRKCSTKGRGATPETPWVGCSLKGDGKDAVRRIKEANKWAHKERKKN